MQNDLLVEIEPHVWVTSTAAPFSPSGGASSPSTDDPETHQTSSVRAIFP